MHFLFIVYVCKGRTVPTSTHTDSVKGRRTVPTSLNLIGVKMTMNCEYDSEIHVNLVIFTFWDIPSFICYSYAFFVLYSKIINSHITLWENSTRALFSSKIIFNFTVECMESSGCECAHLVTIRQFAQFLNQ